MPGLRLSDVGSIIAPPVNPVSGAHVFNESMAGVREADHNRATEDIARRGMGLRGAELQLNAARFGHQIDQDRAAMEAARQKYVGEVIDKAMTMAMDPAQHDHAMSLLRAAGIEAEPIPHDLAKEAAQVAQPQEELPPAPPPATAAGPPAPMPSLAQVGSPSPSPPGMPGLMDLPPEPPPAPSPAQPTEARPAARADLHAGGYVFKDPKQGGKVIGMFNPELMRGQMRENVSAFAQEISRGQLNPRFAAIAEKLAPVVIPELEGLGYDEKKTMEMFKSMVESAFQREQSAENAATVAGRAQSGADRQLANEAWDRIRAAAADARIPKHLESFSALRRSAQQLELGDASKYQPGTPEYDRAVENMGTVMRMVKADLLTASGEGGRRTDADMRQISGKDTQGMLQQVQDWIDTKVFSQPGTNEYKSMMKAVKSLQAVSIRGSVADYQTMARAAAPYAPGGPLYTPESFASVQQYIFTLFGQFDWYPEAEQKYGPQTYRQRSAPPAGKPSGDIAAMRAALKAQLGAGDLGVAPAPPVPP